MAGNLYPHPTTEDEKNKQKPNSSIGVRVCQNLPQTPGVYIMKNAKGEILYIGKAVNLRRRVSSYFLRVYPPAFKNAIKKTKQKKSARTNNNTENKIISKKVWGAHEYRIEKLVKQIKKIEYKKTDTGLEALILESRLIKKHQPPFNVLEKDDRSFLFVEITKEKFPRVLLVRGKDEPNGERFGPFISANSIREVLKIIRRIFPYSTHPTSNIQHLTVQSRPCFYYSLGQCPGTCAGLISQKNYAKIIKNIRLFFAGKKQQILKSLEKEMKSESAKLEFEKAEKIRRQTFALKHIQDIAFISESEISHNVLRHTSNFQRIEGYDISNISGTSAVGSMVVFINGKPDKNSYRKFKIYTVKSPDDTGMIKEILSRRLNHKEWPFPDLILIDGGRGQVNAARSILNKYNFKIPVVGIAKGPERKGNDIIYPEPSRRVGSSLKRVSKKTLIQVRDEAHRFAISYHKKLRGEQMVKQAV